MTKNPLVSHCKHTCACAFIKSWQSCGESVFHITIHTNVIRCVLVFGCSLSAAMGYYRFLFFHWRAPVKHLLTPAYTCLSFGWAGSSGHRTGGFTPWVPLCLLYLGVMSWNLLLLLSSCSHLDLLLREPALQLCSKFFLYANPAGSTHISLEVESLALDPRTSFFSTDSLILAKCIMQYILQRCLDACGASPWDF